MQVMHIWNAIIKCNFFSETLTARSVCDRAILLGIFLVVSCVTCYYYYYYCACYAPRICAVNSAHK
jgi:hypothetical protein